MASIPSLLLLTRSVRWSCSKRLLPNQFVSYSHPRCYTSSTEMTSRFRVVEHLVRCQHTREYPAATANGDTDTPMLAVKQYTPLDNPDPKPGDVTIIAAHANGIPKELYAPLWDELDRRCDQHHFRIRGIWIADLWNQGESGVQNANIMGNDPNWFDHSRDLLNLINQMQDQMPHPIIGIGHSVGATQLAQLSLIHPRLLRALALFEPVIQIPNGGIAPAVLSTNRREIWPSREAARESFKKSKFYQAWDPRVLDIWIQHGLRNVPTALIPAQTAVAGAKDKSVTLTTTKHQELFMYVRPTYHRDSDVARHNDKEEPVDFDPDIPEEYPDYPFYRSEPIQVFKRLPELRPSVLYIFGEKSNFSPPDEQAKKMVHTGVGVGGSGGVKAGQVKQAIVPGGTHFVAIEKVNECADTLAEFIGRELEQWREDAEKFRKSWIEKSLREKAMIDERWVENITPKSSTKL